MIQTIQGHGAANIWYFYISLGGMSACEAVRIGWLDSQNFEVHGDFMILMDLA